ncbi:MAG: hypothetical protein KUA43_13825 [Hoeflea sp.]|uniref:hypothetical protein n=1 Tax=Hoeflea sp. TaxID=1940281 RepID=UPI001D9C7AB4|nr:hypothetical protein [Hoeflea sp.]MBU4531237.1 hypothetical protein [Alphaproteobacteria bacterium]MBU4545700.1 hypothetical protein [Alphaproteobacteria bacterium]MBU4550669.1 hypothetical protein [Alphaproteobacteria bacterium]MBV1724514.1 hypothetical protein [Hoeflea sp.]MBV1760534.1 hypothetical protein [Hoeflea sp.]
MNLESHKYAEAFREYRMTNPQIAHGVCATMHTRDWILEGQPANWPDRLDFECSFWGAGLHPVDLGLGIAEALNLTRNEQAAVTRLLVDFFVAEQGRASWAA